MRGFLADEKHQWIALGVFLVCVAIATGFTIVWIHSDRPCPAGCGRKVDKPNAHFDLCPNKCGLMVYLCNNPHLVSCDGCGGRYYSCNNQEKPEEQESRYRHRVVGAGGAKEHYACSKPRAPSSVRISDK